MKKNLLHIKYKQFRDLCLRLLKMKTRRRGQGAKIKNLKLKIKQLFRELKGQISYAQLLKVPGAALVCLGMTFAQQAQGQITFADPVNTPFGLTANQEEDLGAPKLVDIDGDGDFDMMSAEYESTAFYENIGTITAPIFAEKVENPFGLPPSLGYTLFADFADLDNDGDLDMLSGEGDEVLKYFENTGTVTSPQFAEGINNPFGIITPEEYSLPAFADLDNDGDIDLLVGNYSSFRYYENIGTAEEPQFATPVQSPFNLANSIDDTYFIPTFVDLDNDGDMDIISGEDYGNIRHYENVGTATSPDFAAPVNAPFDISLTNPEGISFPTFADLDNDGDEDLLTGEYGNVNIGFVYYENLTVISSVTDVPEDLTLSVFPNPVSDLLSIKSNYALKNIEVFNILGQPVLSDRGNINSISLTSLPEGMYEVRIELEQGGFVVEKIFKRN